MIRQLLRYVGTLIGLQIVSSGLAYALIDIPWLSIPLALGFLALVWVAGRSLPADLDGDRHPLTVGRRAVHAGLALVIGLLWQFPGLLAPVRFLREELGLALYDGTSDLYDFACESWHLNLMPLLAAIPAGTVDGYHARYYIGLLSASPLLILLFLVAVLWPRQRRAGSRLV